MGESIDINPKQSEVEVAYQILKSHKEAMHFRELMQKVFTIKGVAPDNHQLLASVHTEINMDNRFSFLGQGNWGLKEWTQSKVVRRNLTFATAGRTIPYRHRSLQDEIDYEEVELKDSFESSAQDDHDNQWDD
jgi:DNA-directed RNA polymerase subunit delta